MALEVMAAFRRINRFGIFRREKREKGSGRKFADRNASPLIPYRQRDVDNIEGSRYNPRPLAHAVPTSKPVQKPVSRSFPLEGRRNVSIFTEIIRKPKTEQCPAVSFPLFECRLFPPFRKVCCRQVGDFEAKKGVTLNYDKPPQPKMLPLSG